MWFFETPKVTLTIQPDLSGRKRAGFQSGASLTLTGSKGETIGLLMNRFNTYRGPDEQITVLWHEGRPISFDTILTRSMTVILKSD